MNGDLWQSPHGLVTFLCPLPFPRGNPGSLNSVHRVGAETLLLVQKLYSDAPVSSSLLWPSGRLCHLCAGELCPGQP
jgi:hypothetical protein